MKQILINVETYETRVAVMVRGALEEFHIERSGQTRLAGNIYKGRVESVVPGIGALFVDIGSGKNGFLYIDDVEESMRRNVRKGKELIVQVVKDPIGTKGPLLTSDISIPGKYIVMMPFNNTMGISKRIEDRAERAKIKDVLEKSNLPKGFGCIARTQSLSASPRQIRLEFKYLMNLWSRVKDRSEKQAAPSVVYEEYDLPMRIVRDYYDEDIEKIFIDSKDEFKKIIRFSNSIQSKLKRKIFFYRGNTPLYERYGIEEHIEKIFRRKIFLKSGGCIVIEGTESLTAIDVNTGKYTGKKNPEETVFKTNMEAAREIARQIMLRDIGGIIVIDFIDMDERGHRKEVYKTLEIAFEQDKAKINILTISPIGLVEMTRQRVRQSLESMAFRECPYCNGMGRVKTPATIAINSVRTLRRILFDKARAREVRITAHPDIVEHLQSVFNHTLRSLERGSRKKITLNPDPKLHVENVYFE